MHPSTSTLRRVFAVSALALGLTGSSAIANASSATRWETLEAIHRVENPHNSTRPGSRGELGAYQFRLETWRHYTSTPFNRALDRQTSDAIAIKHYDWIQKGLINARIEPSAYNIALAWNAGIGAVARRTAPAVAHDYATRVSNIARSIHSQNLAAARAAAAKPVIATVPVPPAPRDNMRLGALRAARPTSPSLALRDPMRADSGLLVVASAGL